MRWTIHRVRVARKVKDKKDFFSPVTIYNQLRDEKYSISFKAVIDALVFLEKKGIVKVKIDSVGSKEIKKYKRVLPPEKIDDILKAEAL